MSKEQIMRLQQQLQNVGLYEGVVDGAWGPMSQAAFDAAMNSVSQRSDATIPTLLPGAELDIAWSAKVSPLFVERVKWIVKEIQAPSADDLMACIAWESGETFRPDVRNGAGSGATGLIQFMPATALPYFYSQAAIDKMSAEERKQKGRECCDKLAAMTAEDQLNYVYRYFLPYKGRLKNLGDFYMAILWPNGIGRSDDWVLWEADKRPTTYMQNKGLDVNKDGAITRGECLKKVTEKLTKGLRPENRRKA